MMKRHRPVYLAVLSVGLLLFADLAHAQRVPRVSLRPPVRPYQPRNLAAGHALRTKPPLRALTYLANPVATNNTHRAFTATTPDRTTWIRAGTDVGVTYGDYYVDPAVWTNNAVLLPGAPGWRDPNNSSNWISTRVIRRFIRLPLTLRPDYNQQPER